ncbi:MAG: alkaline phosphatase family protein [Acidobacteriota bacterium]
MPSYINIENNLTAGLTVDTTVSPALSSDDWGVDSSTAPNGETTRVLWMNRDEGIHDKHTWIFTTAFTYAGVAIQLQESLTGTLLSSTLEIQIVAGGKSTGWQSNNTSLMFTGTDGNSYRISGSFFLDEIYDDVTYAISQNILPPINHVVVLMMENRSLDNLLGWVYTDQNNQPPHNIPAQEPTSYAGLVKHKYHNQLTPDSPLVYAKNGTDSTVVPSPDPGEEFTQMTQQIFGASTTADMSGFLANYFTQCPGDPNQIMHSYNPAQVPVISQIAQAFAVSDAWYASAPCQTWPNRGFVHTGSSDGHINNDDSEPYDINTIFNLLKDQGISWMVYNNSIAPSLVHVMFPKLWLELDHFADLFDFVTACQQPATAPAGSKLPQYSFIEPNFLNAIPPHDESYHPPHDITPAEQFLAEVYSAIQACPYRDEILFVITFDEHGGCYDHVPPPSGAEAPLPASVSRDGTFDFSRYGVRVPTIVVSSYVTPGTVFRAEGGTPYDHTTILATLRDWLGINQATFEASLPSPRIAAAPTLASVLTETKPQAWPVIKAPATEAKIPDPTEPPNELVMTIVIGEASRRAGTYIGPVGVAALRQAIQTEEQAHAYFAAQPSKPKTRILLPTRFLPLP